MTAMDGVLVGVEAEAVGIVRALGAALLPRRAAKVQRNRVARAERRRRERAASPRLAQDVSRLAVKLESLRDVPTVPMLDSAPVGALVYVSYYERETGEDVWRLARVLSEGAVVRAVVFLDNGDKRPGVPLGAMRLPVIV